MINKIKLLAMFSIATTFLSCKTRLATENQITNNEIVKKKIISTVMTKDTQDRLTPNEVLDDFIEGNKRFNSGKSLSRDLTIQARKSAPGQFPKAVVLSCLDSRVPVEDVFDQGLGDVFVVN